MQIGQWGGRRFLAERAHPWERVLFVKLLTSPQRISMKNSSRVQINTIEETKEPFELLILDEGTEFKITTRC